MGATISTTFRVTQRIPLNRSIPTQATLFTLVLTLPYS